jgi:hypothetical protein
MKSIAEIAEECARGTFESAAGHIFDEEGRPFIPLEPLPADWDYLDDLDREVSEKEKREFADEYLNTIVDLIEQNGGGFCDRCNKLRRIKFINTPRVPQRRYYCQTCYMDADLEILASGWGE